MTLFLLCFLYYDTFMIDLLHKANTEHNLSKEEIIKLLSLEDSTELFKCADEVRKKYVGDEIHLRALIEFSNICSCNCYYCGLRCGNKNILRYRLTKEEILLRVKEAVKLGFKTIVLQSGEDAYYSVDYLQEIISEIKKYDVALTLGIGERSKEEYKAFKDAGADRFLLRIETTDKSLYLKLHPNMSFENRLRCLYDLKELGYEVGTGCLVGLPNQTLESLADDILFFKELDVDMVGIGPLIIHPDTPLKNFDNGSFNLALKVMAITRLLLPDINIPATTAMETLVKNGRIKALQSGANVIMPNFTGGKVAEKYKIYPNKIITSFQNVVEDTKMLGRNISDDYGSRTKHNSL